MGIEPTSLAWKAKVLPLNYTRFLAGAYFRKLGLKADTSYPARLSSLELKAASLYPSLPWQV